MSEHRDDKAELTSEREALEKFLDAQRDRLIRKVEGVGDEAARKAPTASSLSLLGVLKHVAVWERRWFQVLVAGREFPGEWPAVLDDPDDALFLVDGTDTVDRWIAFYREQIGQSRAVVAALDLDSQVARSDLFECNVRYVLFHMIEETARHAGHADIIRETLDGSTGL